MTKAITFTYNIAQENFRQITAILLGLCLVMTLGYAINIYRVVSQTVALKHVAAETAAVNSTLQQLDTQYASVTGKITPDVLAKYGFTTEGSNEKTFISRTASLGRVSSAGHEL